MQDPEFADIVALICKEDGRYDRRAYDFVRRGLDATVHDLRKREPARTGASRHVTPAELLQGLRAYALDQFGPLAKTVLEAWGVRSGRDFGEIVFNLIEHAVFSKTDSDRREDFAGVYDFDEAFVQPFLPGHRRADPPAAEKVA
jgi:uncharacterized repeat protein (TIGR04138 family)